MESDHTEPSQRSLTAILSSAYSTRILPPLALRVPSIFHVYQDANELPPIRHYLHEHDNFGPSVKS